MKESNLKTLTISQGREKAKAIAELDFDRISIANYVMETNLKGRDVEYERNFNPRYVSKEKMVYTATDSEALICNKANNNYERLIQIVSNANRDFRANYQYIVYHKTLVEAIQQWLGRMELLAAHVKYGKIDEDLKDFRRIFYVPQDKEWLVVDGNSYFSTIHQTYLVREQFKNKHLPSEIKSWANYYNFKASKGKAYTVSGLSQNEYEKDVQMLQLLALVLDKNIYSWGVQDVDLFYRKLYRLIYIVSYTHCVKAHHASANEVFSTMQALIYLTMPTKQLKEYKQTKRIDFITFEALFGGNESGPQALQSTTFNIQLFRRLIEGLLTKNSNHLQLDYVLDCFNETFLAMVKYQNDSLELLEGTEAQSARDRLSKISTLMMPKLKHQPDLRNELINNMLPVQVYADKLQELISLMLTTYEEYLTKNLEKLISNNRNLDNNILSVYKMLGISKVSYKDFKNMVLDAVKA